MTSAGKALSLAPAKGEAEIYWGAREEQGVNQNSAIQNHMTSLRNRLE
jgi:hypothetical protein